MRDPSVCSQQLHQCQLLRILSLISQITNGLLLIDLKSDFHYNQKVVKTKTVIQKHCFNLFFKKISTKIHTLPEFWE